MAMIPSAAEIGDLIPTSIIMSILCEVGHNEVVVVDGNGRSRRFCIAKRIRVALPHSKVKARLGMRHQGHLRSPGISKDPLTGVRYRAACRAGDVDRVPDGPTWTTACHTGNQHQYNQQQAEPWATVSEPIKHL
jgi:hypothetical protein